MEPNYTQKPLHSKNPKWEKISVNTTDKGLIFQIYKQLMHSIWKKNPIKNGQKIQTDISPKKTYIWPRGMWKDVSIFRETIREMQVKTAMRYHTVQNSHHLKIYKQ